MAQKQCEHAISLTEDYAGPESQCPVHGDHPAAPQGETGAPSSPAAADASALLPCPFCGGQPNEFEDGEIQCSTKTGCVRPGRCYDKHQWNTRNNGDAIAAAERIVKTAQDEVAQEAQERIAELERRLRIPFGKFPCAQCGGPHDFDTTIPSVVWNQIIRAKGLPEYLCTTCIIREFVREGIGFTAQLWNEEFNGVPIEVIVNGQNANDAATISDENTSLRVELAELRTRSDLTGIDRAIKVVKEKRYEYQQSGLPISTAVANEILTALLAEKGEKGNDSH